MAAIFDDRICELGEGVLWHPERGQLYWFDILAGRILARHGSETRQWDLGRIASAAGWIDADTLFVATETGLCTFDIGTGALDEVAPLEADNPATRSNDGRADPMGGFWIGTMGKKAERHAGTIYRYYRGEVRALFPKITIPNTICFSPDGRTAYWSDSVPRRVYSQALDAEGWPVGEPSVFSDREPDGHKADGAVTDAEGNVWIAEWGSFRVACYSPEGMELEVFEMPCRQPSCPAFGEDGYGALYVTSAREGLGERADVHDGLTYRIETGARGKPEPRVIL
ncbi:SMP-30/gluconolactonase/LRE family protein [Rhodobacterales bacterium HKCCE2091]|nr:SMP-30/gluconolactonase/LRE family protein [Rhodobacterales bacterium HKCCE2091]